MAEVAATEASAPGRYDGAAVSKPPKAPESGSRSGLSTVTTEWLAASDPAGRKSRGQYMTPRPVAEALLDRVLLVPGMTVLDPGVGTGELLRAALDREPGIRASGWDADPEVLEAAGRLVPEANLSVRSALEARDAGEWDLVIGNPPYFQLRLDGARRERFTAVISGRPNIFALFFQVGLEQLRPGGTLAYIVPPSMNSGAYFEGLREYLTAAARIVDLTILPGTGIFEGANTAVQLLVLEKREGPIGEWVSAPEPFAFRREVSEAGFRRVIFSPEPARLAGEFEGRRTLWELGLEASTGQVIWNENRNRLSADPGPGRVPLVWSHSIPDGPGGVGLRGPEWSGPGRPDKPGFYDTRDGGRKPLSGPAIVVNRVVGAVGRGELRAALIPEGSEFLAENHVNVILPRPGAGQAVDWEGVLASLRAPGVAGRVRLLTGNTQISARELTHLLPLD